MARAPLRHLLIIGWAAVLTATGCSFNGVNSLPLPGAQGRGTGAQSYHVELANVASLEPNSPVMIDDVVIGSVGQMTVRDRHADVEISVKADVVVPANAVASVGQTSLLGSMHLQLNPPLGEAPSGRLQPGATMPLNQSSTYPSTEKTLSALSLLVNGGGLGQVGDIIHNLGGALSGHEDQLRDLLTRLNDFIGTLDTQRDDIIESIHAVNRLAETFATQRDVIDRALRDIPPALDVLVRERPRITTALRELGVFSETATRVVDDTQADLVTNLQNLQPLLRVLADVGPDLDFALSAALVYPYTQNFIDRAIRGDYLNLFAAVDLTVPRLKRTLLLGTRFGQQNAPLVPAPGDPSYLNYTYDPLAAAVAPRPPDAAAPPTDGASTAPPFAGPILPVTPPPPPGAALDPTEALPAHAQQIFAGPYPAEATPPGPGTASLPPKPTTGDGG